MAAAVCLLQDRLLYMPAKAGVERIASGGLRAWPSPQDFRGLVAEPAGPVRGTAIVFHGNAGHAGHHIFYAAALTQLGLRVILAEYPGYGPRGGLLGEESLVNHAGQTVALAKPMDTGPQAWVCRGQQCLPPMADIESLLACLTKHEADA